MVLRKSLVAGAAIIVAGLSATQTMGQDTISRTIHLTANVPVLCSVQLQPFGGMSTGGGVVDLGTTQEFCNAPRGYRVILQHPSHMTGASVLSGTTRIPLSASGETVVTDSDQPAIETRRLALDLGDAPQQVERLGLRIEAKY